MSPKGESFESDSNVYTEEKNEPEDQIQEPFSVEPEEKITEDLSSEEQENLESDKKEKKKTKQQLLWQECLDNIKNEGTEKKEIEGIIEETTEIAQEMLKTVSDELQQEKAKELKEEFAEAVRERSEPLYPIDAHSVIKTFNNQIDMLVQNKAMQYQEPFFTEPVPQNIAEQKKPVIPEKSPQKNTTGPTISQPKPSVTTQPSSSGKITQSTIVVQQPSVDIATQKIQKETAEKAKNEALRKIKEQQELLAKKMQVTALQKAAEKKTESEKGIITSLKEKIFGKTETPEQRTVAELRKEQDQLIEQMVQHKFDRTAKDLIKTAYHIFQETLVGFDRPEFWDIDRNMPNKKWMKTIIEALKVLLKYDIMNLDTISTILKETLQTTSKMTIKSYTDIMNEINAQLQNYIQQIEKEKIERKKQAEREMKQQQQELIEQGERERQRIVVEELQKQEELHKQEQEKNNTIKQFTSLELEWERLLWKITQDKSASNASNRKFTEQALKITKNMVKLLPQMPIKNKKDIIEKHIQEFTKALIAQQKNNDEHINVHHYIEIFNIKIHTL